MRALVISILLVSMTIFSACNCETTTSTVTQTEEVTTTITHTVTSTETITVKLTDSISDYLSAILLLENYADRVDIQYYSEGNELVSVVLERGNPRFTELLQILKECPQHKILPRYSTTIENGVTRTLTITIDYGGYPCGGYPCFHFVLDNGDSMFFSLSEYLYYENDNVFYIALCNEIAISEFLATFE